MAGYYTTSRQVPLLQYQFKKDGAVLSNVSLTGKQTTMSYRSSQPAGANEQTYADLLRPLAYSTLMSSDDGHDFYTSKATLLKGNAFKGEGGYPVQRPSSNGSVVVSPLIPMALYMELLDGASKYNPPTMSVNDKTFYGNRFISEVAPTAPSASLANFLGEISRDGLPSVISSVYANGRHITGQAKALGNDFLNVEFGWKPFMSDLASLMSAVTNSTRIINQYVKDSGKKNRREATLAMDPVVGDLAPRSGYAVGIASQDGGDYAANAYTSACKIQQTLNTTYRFVGSFTYALPGGSTLLEKAAYFGSLAQKVLGAGMTPEAIWNLAPWTWLVDWWLDVGSAVSAAQRLQTDNLVVRYGYIMKHTTDRRIFTLTGGSYKGWSFPNLAMSLTYETKERWHSTPFGFAVNPATVFNANRAAIVASLISSGNWRRSK